MAQDDNARRPGGSGWTQMHSWIFLAIIAAALLVVVAQNRYHYISPLGLGKAYRIDKVFGGIHEFDPDKGWIKAVLQSSPPSSPMAMMQPPMQPGPSVPLQMPGTMPPSSVAQIPGPPSIPSSMHREEPQPPVTEPPREMAKPKEHAKKETRELSQAEKLELFKKAFPDYGKEEFALANDDLYADWKKNVSPGGTWPEFLQVYGDFVQWWSDQGQPPEPGVKLWKDFVATRPKR